MYIGRVQVEEGFLRGIDVQFAPGLNAIIGARGTGKTSLIELIRFCLDASGSASETARRSREHALSILGGGQVTVTLVSGGQYITVSRTADESAPRATGPYGKPIVFSQTEIETIGLQPNGRLSLLDGFVDLPNSDGIAEAQAIADVKSLTKQIDDARREIEELSRLLSALPQIETELELAASQESIVATATAGLGGKTQQLHYLSNEIAQSGAKLSSYEQLDKMLATWYQSVEAARGAQIDLHGLPPETQRELAQTIAAARDRLTEATRLISQAYQGARSNRTAIEGSKLSLEATARQLRLEVESLQTGAGEIMRRSQQLREQQAKLLGTSDRIRARQGYLNTLLVQRNQSLDSLESIRSWRSDARARVVDFLNREVGPNIRLRLIRNAQSSAFAATIGDLMRGSGLKYGEIVSYIANHLTPRTLMTAVDDFDVEFISQAAKIPADRASRLLAYLRTVDLSGMVTLNLDDDIEMQLLDGRDYKNLNTLSTGQRCTVILPILLAHRDRMLIVDQPEDHIDNAFIASTLIKSLVNRVDDGQIIFSTHNPNIPVLGNASRVLHLGSDGGRGYAFASGSLHSPEIISSITNVMEGGANAFRYRANFYGGADLL